VRRASGARGGRPHNVYDPDTGRPLEIPVDATLDDLRDRGLKPGRYRLDAVKDDGLLIPGVVASTELPEEDDRDDEEEIEQVPADMLYVPVRVFESVERMVETMNCTVKALASAFGTVRPVRESAPSPVAVAPAPALGGAAASPLSAQSLENIMSVVMSVMEKFGSAKAPEASS
jgi:hypothetical protein